MDTICCGKQNKSNASTACMKFESYVLYCVRKHGIFLYKSLHYNGWTGCQLVISTGWPKIGVCQRVPVVGSK